MPRRGPAPPQGEHCPPVAARTLIVDVPAGDRRGPWLERSLAALAAFPASRAVIAEVADCWADLGQPERALALLQTSLLVAPGDRTLDRAMKELSP